MKPLLRIASLVLGALLLGSCYLPGSFDAEIELSRTGLYKMSFDGYIVEITLYDDLRQGKLTPEQEKEKVAVVINDFQRDGDTKEVSYYGQGAFHVVWQTSGDITTSRMVTFFRRNENMLSISYNEDTGTIALAGKYIKKQDADRLEQMGLGVQGVLRIKTDARVVSHNATKTTQEGPITIYGWRLETLRDPAPKMLVSF